MTNTMDAFVNGPLRAFADALARCKADGGYTVREGEVLETLDNALTCVLGEDGSA